MKATEKAYIAGIIDGEGTIGMYLHNKPLFEVRVVVQQHPARQDIVDFIHKVYPGACNKNKLYTSWGVSAKKAKKLLLKVLPYLVSKKLNARIAIAVLMLREGVWNIANHKNPSERHIPETVTCLYEEGAELLRRLNHREKESPPAETECEDFINRCKAARRIYELMEMRQSTL